MLEKKVRARYESIKKEMNSSGQLFYAARLLERAAQLHPNHTALICKTESITYKELFERAEYVAQKLRAIGIGQADSVCLWYENSIEFYVGYFGIWHTGAVVVPLNTFLHPKEFMHIVLDCTPAALLISQALLATVPASDKSQLPPLFSDDVLTADRFVFESSQPVLSIPDRDPDELSVLLYTSGTTGTPKGVMLSNRNIMTNIAQSTSQIDLTPQDRIYGLLPLFHSFAQIACIWSPFWIAATIIIVPKVDRKFVLQAFEYKPTIVLGVPAFYGLLCLFRTVNLDSVRYFLSGGDALPDKIRGLFELIYGRKICNGYGLTETTPFIAASKDDQLLHTNMVGPVACDIQYEIRAEDGAPVPAGSIGVLWVRGQNVMLGYYNAPDATKHVLKDGWFDTGDFAKVDKQGRIIICGREKDLIINKGFNIYPQEIENILMSHPLVLKAGVVGIDNPDLGQFPVAFLLLKEKSESIVSQALALCNSSLAHYKVPRSIIVVDDMPVTSLGKIDKKKLKALYEQH